MTEYYWLNEDSRTFLERGYLKDGETPEQRIKDIADTAEKYLGISGFSDNILLFFGGLLERTQSVRMPVHRLFCRHQLRSAGHGPDGL